MAQDDATTAFVLSGGGAYGAYQVGVVKALAQGQSPATGFRPLRAGVLVGTSIGAMNAAVLASRSKAGDGAAYLERVWLEGMASDRRTGRPGAVRVRGDASGFAFPAEMAATLVGDGLSLASEFLARAPVVCERDRSVWLRSLELFDPAALLDISNFPRVLQRTIDLAGVRRSKQVLRLLATNWRTGELRTFGNADLTDANGHAAIQASATFPGLRPIVIDGEPYVDGSYLVHRPTQPAWDAGARTMHVVYPDPDVSAIPLRRFDNVIDVLDKLFHITAATIFDRDLELARDINAGLALLAGDPPAKPLPTSEMRGLLRLAGRVTQAPDGLPPYRPLTIHRYHPGDDLGGALGLLNFDPGHIRGLIDRGYQDAVRHDCAANKCILADRI
jgi:predicted acylesterase/phospholipase RssA